MASSRFELPGEGLGAAQVCLVQRLPAGDPARIRAAARRSDARAAELRRTASTLLSRLDSPLWSGAAHRAFVDQLRAHAPSISATADRYEHYAAALYRYAGALDETAPRLTAARLLLQQRYDELARPGPAPLSPGAWEPGYPPWVPRSSADPSSFGSAPASDGAAALLEIAREFKAGYDRWADALDRCIHALSHADQADPPRDRHGLQALEHRVAGWAGRQVATFERAVRHPSLGNISDCLEELNVDLTVLGLGLLFICPPVGTACLAAATVLAVARLAVDSTRRARGEQVSAGSLGLELAAAIPVGGSAFRGLRATGDVVHLVPGGGLAAHEGVEGGHTIAKHVGKSPAYLRHRLATEPWIGAASTFYNREVAESAISEVLEAHDKAIRTWLAGPKAKLVISSATSRACGLGLPRAGTDLIESSTIRVVLHRSGALGPGYRIDTAMVIV